MRILVIFIFSINLSLTAQELSLASFNIGDFGKVKSAKKEVMDTIVSIISSYDIIGIQEFQDKTGIGLIRLRMYLDSAEAGNYKILASERTGKQENDKNSKEQYLFVFDTNKLEIVKHPFFSNGIIEDGEHDKFQREPHLVSFRTRDKKFSFSLVNIHTKPGFAYEEISALLAFGDSLVRHNEVVFLKDSCKPMDNCKIPGYLAHLILAGDFNADCSYLTNREEAELKQQYPNLVWITPDSLKTNVGRSRDCTYDRMVITVSLKPFLSQNAGVDRRFCSKKISGHYPIYQVFKY